jgi:hypothetical protein
VDNFAEVRMIGRRWFASATLIFGAALVATSCGTLRTSNGAGGPGSDDLTAVDLADYSTVLEAVQALRPRWLYRRTTLVLSPRGGTEAANPVWVYWDGTRLGDPSHLSRIPTSQVSRIIHFDARTASLRWGSNHENGVIYLVPAVGSVGPVFH